MGRGVQQQALSQAGIGIEDARVIGTCLVTGHAAGVAAAVAVRKGTSVQDADVGRIRALLAQQKAYLG